MCIFCFPVWLISAGCGFMHFFDVEAPWFKTTGSVVTTPRLSWSVTRGIFPDQGLSPSLLHWQPDSLPLSHQGSPLGPLFINTVKIAQRFLMLAGRLIVKILYHQTERWGVTFILTNDQQSLYFLIMCVQLYVLL